MIASTVRKAARDTRNTALKFWAFVGLALVISGPPPSLWMSVDDVYVAPAIEGMAPKMHVDRSINIPFDATFTVELEQWQQSGKGWSFHDKASPSTLFHYSTDNVLPDNLDLDWWAFPNEWRIGAGLWRITTCWNMRVWFFGKRMCIQSNGFRVYPVKEQPD